jgi:hypothetical protein
MVSPTLKLVEQSDERPMKRVQQLQEQARAIVMEEITGFENALLQLCEQAKELAEAGELVPAGVRELCRSFADDAEMRAKTLGSLIVRQR